MKTTAHYSNLFQNVQPSIPIGVVTAFNPQELYRKDNKELPSLFPWRSFEHNILPYAVNVSNLPSASYRSAELANSTLSEKIIKGFKIGKSDVSETLAHIYQMIMEQELNGKGELLKNGDPNLFYMTAGTFSLVADVYFRQFWRIDGWLTSGRGERGGSKIFARN